MTEQSSSISWPVSLYTSPEGKIRAASPDAAEALGLLRDPLSSTPLRDLFHSTLPLHQQTWEETLDRLLAEPAPLFWDYPIQTAASQPLSLSVLPLEEPSGEVGLLWLLWDFDAPAPFLSSSPPSSSPPSRDKEQRRVRKLHHELGNALGASLGYATLLQRKLPQDHDLSSHVKGLYEALVEATTLLNNYSSDSPSQGSLEDILDEEQAAAEDLPFFDDDEEQYAGCERLLLVDDEPQLHELFVEYLEQLGYEVLTAPNGEVALEIFAREKDELDLVLLDMSLPGKSGLEVFQEIHKKRPRLRVILISGYVQDADVENALKQGASSFLHKPFHMDALGAAIRQILDGPAPSLD